MEGRCARGAHLERGGGGAGDRPAGMRGARSGLGIAAQDHHGNARLLRGEDQAAAGDEIVFAHPPPGFHHHARGPRAAHGIERGTQQRGIVGGVDDDQPRGVQPERRPAFAARLHPQGPRALPDAQQQDRPPGAGLYRGEPEGQGGGPAIGVGMDFVKLPFSQPRKAARGRGRRGRWGRIGAGTQRDVEHWGPCLESGNMFLLCSNSIVRVHMRFSPEHNPSSRARPGAAVHGRRSGSARGMRCRQAATGSRRTVRPAWRSTMSAASRTALRPRKVGLPSGVQAMPSMVYAMRSRCQAT